jgi:hypothetical protein
VEDFGKPKGAGEMLQERLRKYSETAENWVGCYNLKVYYLLAHK